MHVCIMVHCHFLYAMHDMLLPILVVSTMPTCVCVYTVHVYMCVHVLIHVCMYM